LQADLRRCLTCVWTPPGGRIIAAHLDLAPRLLTVIGAYAPQSSRPEDERRAFYQELAEVIQRAERKAMVLVLGDLNARLHARMTAERDVIGPHIYGLGLNRIQRPDRGYGETTNRDLLVQLCLTGGRDGRYLIMNTWFCKPDRHKVTCMAPGVSQLPKGGHPLESDRVRRDRFLFGLGEVEDGGARR